MRTKPSDPDTNSIEDGRPVRDVAAADADPPAATPPPMVRPPSSLSLQSLVTSPLERASVFVRRRFGRFFREHSLEALDPVARAEAAAVAAAIEGAAGDGGGAHGHHGHHHHHRRISHDHAHHEPRISHRAEVLVEAVSGRGIRRGGICFVHASGTRGQGPTG